MRAKYAELINAVIGRMPSWKLHIDGLVYDSSISSELAMKILQSST